MSPKARTRSRAFWLGVAIGLTVCAVALTARRDEPTSHSPRLELRIARRRAPRRQLGRVGAAPARRGRANRQPEDFAARELRPPPTDAIRVAHRFLAAFLAYEVGGPTAHRTEELSATSAPSFARLLTSAAARVPHGAAQPVPGRLTELVAGRMRPNGSLSVLATVNRGSVTTGMLLLLERKDARWVVVRIAG